MRKIIHADCDCFFAAVEIRDNPSLIDKPIAVGGDADKRGVIATCNYSARAYGVRSAMPTAQALKLCPDLILCKGRMDEYKATAAAIREIFFELTDRVEVVSIDEAYLDVTDVAEFQGSATRMAQWLKAEVVKRTGVTISTGVAANKFLAKVASDWQKPDGLFVVTPDQVEDFVIQLPVGRIHGVGKVTEEKLKRLGIETCADLQQKTVKQLTEWFGKFGLTLYQRARGEDYREVVTERVRKSVSVERTYSENITRQDDLDQALDRLLPVLARRYQGYEDRQIRSVFAKVRFADFSSTTVETAFGSELISSVSSTESSDASAEGLSDIVADKQAEYSVAWLKRALFYPLMQEAVSRGSLNIRLLGIGVRLRDPAGPSEQLSLFPE
ncbi:DNA polymerase IV [Oceanospirillum sanctuarii]|uniref:DNA polymerase IV n=1 Tax=Oceanospirillum sanctuarii TaxID=1434821 RepID=UPI000A3B9B9D|nr:DNA polymerase IV [Oceanospirillum sanctuarii]